VLNNTSPTSRTNKNLDPDLYLYDPFEVTDDPFFAFGEKGQFDGCCRGYEGIPPQEWIAPPANDNSPNACLNEALRDASERDWFVFPADLSDGAKKSHKSAEFSKDGRRWGATKDPKQIRRDFKRWPEAIGVPTGIDNGIFVAETDTIEGHSIDGRANLRMLEAKHGRLPPTLMAVSPSGSIHHYFKHPGGKIKSCTIAPGVDIKGDGGMVIAPPSLRSDGRYRWLNARPIADAPDWLIERVRDDAPAQDRSNNGGEKDPFEQWRFEAPIEKIVKTLAAISNNDAPWEKWNLVLMATFNASGRSLEGLMAAVTYSKRSGKYNARTTLEKWLGYFKSPPTNVGYGKLKYLADQDTPGWDEPQQEEEKQEEKTQKEEREWPVLHPDALYGIAGKVVALFDPHTESDPVALLLQFLVSLGNALDRGPYFLIEGTKHYTNLNALLIGELPRSSDVWGPSSDVWGPSSAGDIFGTSGTVGRRTDLPTVTPRIALFC
jgi:hypothetical protein